MCTVWGVLLSCRSSSNAEKPHSFLFDVPRFEKLGADLPSSSQARGIYLTTEQSKDTF